MSMPEEIEIGYGDAAQLYWDAGWRGVLPLRRGKKFPPPNGRTGHDGADPVYVDPKMSDRYPRLKALHRRGVP